MVPIQVSECWEANSYEPGKSILISYPVLGAAISVQVMATPTSQINLKFVVLLKKTGR